MKTEMGLSSQPESIRPVLTISVGEPVARAARSMQRHRVGSLIAVEDNGEMAGILTERDILISCTAIGKGPKNVRVAEVMTKEVISTGPGTPIDVADEIMATHGIRHLPVVEDGKPVGMISARDVMAARLGIVQALKDAAEQIALLSRNVREPDIQELLDRLADEIPKVFGAKRWALHLASRDNGSEGESLIQRMNCSCGVDTLADRAGSVPGAGDKPITADPPESCQCLGADGYHAVVSLTQPGADAAHDSDREGGSSYLCMCGLDKSDEQSGEVLRYKLSLVASILAVNFANARLYKAAYRDSLTGLRARRALEEALEGEYSRAMRHGSDFCVAMLDVDNFKNINDTYGHAAGDAVLRRLGEVIVDCARAHDLPARHGGDEVAILMPETNLEGALSAIERLRLHIDRELRVPGGEPVTVSCGIAEWSGQSDDVGSAVVRRADDALYNAKRKGRNCVVTAGPARTV